MLAFISQYEGGVSPTGNNCWLILFFSYSFGNHELGHPKNLQCKDFSPIGLSGKYSLFSRTLLTKSKNEQTTLLFQWRFGNEKVCLFVYIGLSHCTSQLNLFDPQWYYHRAPIHSCNYARHSVIPDWLGPFTWLIQKAFTHSQLTVLQAMLSYSQIWLGAHGMTSFHSRCGLG